MHRYELWKSDGSLAGTVLVRDVAQGATGSMSFEFSPPRDTRSTSRRRTISPGRELEGLTSGGRNGARRRSSSGHGVRAYDGHEQ
ncbi:MAG: hypothetical protein IPP07_21440 [Holophagales bacterium]|nr:hypothetical protein [Holophagales bacterium]